MQAQVTGNEGLESAKVPRRSEKVPSNGTVRPEVPEERDGLSSFLEFLQQSAEAALDGRKTAVLLNEQAGRLPADSRFRQVCSSISGVDLNAGFTAWLDRNTDRAAELFRGHSATLPSPSADILLLPVTGREGLEAVLCLELEPPLPAPTLRQLEAVSRLCGSAGAVIAALRESSEWRRNAAPSARRPEALLSTTRPSEPERERWALLHQIRTCVLSNAVHGLRTPLLAIRGYAYLLLDGQTGPLNAKQNQHLTVILENVAKLADLVNHVQDLPVPGQLRLETMDMGKLLEESLEPFRARAAQKSIHFFERVVGDPLRTAGDREKLGLVFRRLLSNAVQFTGAGGEIHTDIRYEPDQIVIRISDTGDGMPPEFVGESYSRRDRSRGASAAPGSNGSGRSIVREIVRMHGGRISWTTALGEGCTTVITFPVIQLAGPEALQRYG